MKWFIFKHWCESKTAMAKGMGRFFEVVLSANLHIVYLCICFFDGCQTRRMVLNSSRGKYFEVKSKSNIKKKTETCTLTLTLVSKW